MYFSALSFSLEFSETELRQGKMSSPVWQPIPWSAAASVVIGFTWAAGGTHFNQHALRSHVWTLLLPSKLPSPRPLFHTPRSSLDVLPPLLLMFFSLACFVFGLRGPPPAPEPVGWSWHGSREGKQRSRQLCIRSKCGFYLLFYRDVIWRRLQTCEAISEGCKANKTIILNEFVYKFYCSVSSS